MNPKSLVALAAGLLLVWCVGPSAAKVRRADTGPGGNWGQVGIPVPPTDTDLLALPIHWPVGQNGKPLHVNPMGLVPSSFNTLATPPNYVASGWQIDDGTLPATIVPIATVMNFTIDDKYYDDAQVLPCFEDENIDPITEECTLHFADSDNRVLGLDVAWRTSPQSAGSTYAQVMYFYLGSPNSVHIYDATGTDRGVANNAWEISFNCDPDSPTSCSGPASLEWEGQVYTATSELLTSPDPDPRYSILELRLNEFVYNDGTLYPPPGWLAATSTALVASGSPITLGTSVALIATVSVVKADMPTGEVTFRSGNNVLGTAPLNTAGIANFNASSLPEGTHNITATYGGDAKSAVSVSAATTVVVNAPPPTLTLGTSPTSIPLGQSATLTWQSTNATSCTASNGWTGSKVVSGSQAVTPAAAGTATYALACSGSGGNISRSVDVTVHPLPTASLSVAPTSITVGQNATLTWSSTNATACTAGGSWSGSQATNGTSNVTPSTSGTLNYTVACTGAGGTANASATLTVNAASNGGGSSSSSSGGGGGAMSMWAIYALLLLVTLRVLAARRNARGH